MGGNIINRHGGILGISDLLYAGLYYHGIGIVVNCVLADTFYGVTGLSDGIVSPLGARIRRDGVAGTITIGTNGGGIYQPYFGASHATDKVSKIHLALFLNGVELEPIACEDDSNVIGLFHGCNRMGPIALVPGDVMTFKISSDTANTAVTFTHLSYGVGQIVKGN